MNGRTKRRKDGEGAIVGGAEPRVHPIWRIAGVMGDFVALNLLFLLCSLPVVTVGQAATALNDAMFRRIEDRDTKFYRDFFTAMKADIWQGVLLTILSLAAVAGLYADIRVMQANPDAFPFASWAFLGLAAILILLTIPYAFAIRAKYRNSLWQTIKKAFILAMTHPLQSIIVAVLSFLPVALFLFATYYFIYTSIWWFLAGFSVTAWITGKLLLPVFRLQEHAGNSVEGGEDSNDD